MNSFMLLCERILLVQFGDSFAFEERNTWNLKECVSLATGAD